MQIRIGTFNCENLYVFHRLRKLDIRFELRKKKDKNKAYKEKLAKIEYDKSGVPITSLEQGWEIKDSQRQITARSIIENQPDIIALQEVENLDTLNKFYRDFMKSKIFDRREIFGDKNKKIQWKMDYRILVDGNDSHRIDVALMSRFPIKNIRTHIWDLQKNSWRSIFPRDCLEVDVEIPYKNKIITFLVNHFTSRLSDKTGTKRKNQANHVIKILKDRFGKKLDGGNFVIAGDLNDSPKDSSLSTTLYNKKYKFIDPLKQVPEQERWTHFWYTDKGKAKEVSQLDHVILSPSFKKSNTQVTIERRGLLQTIKDLNNVGNIPTPFDGVSRELNTEGSDHCPVYVDLEVNDLI